MAMVQTKRLAALLLALLLTLFLLPSALADSGVVSGTTVSGTVRVYLSSISSLTAVDVSIAGSYSVGGDTSRALSRGQNIRVSNSGGTLMMTANGQTQTMGSRFKLRRHQTSGENGVRIAQARYPASLYPGDIEFIAKGGNVQIVVHVYMEDYMLGVLPYEMDNSFPLEALKAQAVAARTYALKKMSVQAATYDVVDTTSDQVYNGTPSGFENVCEDEAGRTKPYVLHAEANAIISASRNECIGGDIYLVGHDAKTGTILSDATSCSMCRRMIINAGLRRVVIRNSRTEFTIVQVQDWIDQDDTLEL